MFELEFIPSYPQEIIATDEVGRGPLSGPVVVGAVRVFIQSADELKVILKFLKSLGVTDSKKLTSIKRIDLLTKIGVKDRPFRTHDQIEIKGIKIDYLTWEMDHEIIDQENILAASLRGMKEAASALSEAKKNQTTVLIDGNKKFKWPKKSPWNEIPIVKGDLKSSLIGLASIIAKEKRDGFMKQMHEIYPEYGFNLHSGYPTAAHRKAIEIHGPSPIHRKTFKGVREFLRT
jgi:ribonuclease HII